MHWDLSSAAGLCLLVATLINVMTTLLGFGARKRIQPVSNILWWRSKLSALAVCAFAAKVASDSGDELSARVLFFALPIVSLLVAALAWHRHRL